MSARRLVACVLFAGLLVAPSAARAAADPELPPSVAPTVEASFSPPVNQELPPPAPSYPPSDPRPSVDPELAGHVFQGAPAASPVTTAARPLPTAPAAPKPEAAPKTTIVPSISATTLTRSPSPAPSVSAWGCICRTPQPRPVRPRDQLPLTGFNYTAAIASSLLMLLAGAGALYASRCGSKAGRS